MNRVLLASLVLASVPIAWAGNAIAQTTRVSAPATALPRNSAPAAQIKLPNLAVVSSDGNQLTIRNVGNADAVFAVAADLVSLGDVRVPAGGRVSAGQSVTVTVNGLWACPDSLYADWQYPIVATWPYKLPQPAPIEGHKPLLLDPDGIVTESDETDNVVLLRRPNPYRPSGDPARPDLRVVRVTTYPSSQTIQFNVDIQNVGAGPVYLCDNSQLTGSYPAFYIVGIRVDGVPRSRGTIWKGDPAVIQPGETVLAVAYDKLAYVDQFGVKTPGIEPGCHKVEVTVDDKNVVPESNECDNTVTTYIATGGAACPASQPATLVYSKCTALPNTSATRKLSIAKPVPVPVTGH